MDRDKWDLMVREDVDRIYDRIIMVTNVPKNADKIVMLVEGRYDKEFYEQFVILRNVIVFFTGGCERMNALAEILRNNEFEYLAIQDSDFRKLGAQNTGMINMFFTDFHDYEMTCISDRNIWAKIDAVLELSANGIYENDFYSEIETLSYYRYCSRMMDMYNGFKALGKWVCDVDTLDYTFIHSHIESGHPEFKDIQQGYLNGFIANNSHVKSNPYNFHNGHDVLNRIVYKINQEETHPYYDCDEDEIQEVLRKCTDLTDFKNTDLYKDVKTWSAEHKEVFKAATGTGLGHLHK